MLKSCSIHVHSVSFTYQYLSLIGNGPGLSKGSQLPDRCRRLLLPREWAEVHLQGVKETPHVTSHSVETNSGLHHLHSSGANESRTPAAVTCCDQCIVNRCRFQNHHVVPKIQGTHKKKVSFFQGEQLRKLIQQKMSAWKLMVSSNGFTKHWPWPDRITESARPSGVTFTETLVFPSVDNRKWSVQRSKQGQSSPQFRLWSLFLPERCWFLNITFLCCLKMLTNEA